MNTQLALVAAKALPTLSGSSLSYNPEENVFLTLGHTSRIKKQEFNEEQTVEE